MTKISRVTRELRLEAIAVAFATALALMISGGAAPAISHWPTVGAEARLGFEAREMSPLKTATPNAVTNWTVLNNYPIGNGEVGVAYDSGRGQLFASNANTDNVSVVNGSTGQIVTNVTVGTDPQGVAYDPGTGQVFVANYGSSNVSVISDTTDKVVANVAVLASPLSLLYDPAQHQVFVANYNGAALSVISDATDLVVKTIPIAMNPTSDPAGMAYDPTLGEIFATVQFGHSVDVVSDSSDTVLKTIQVGLAPRDAIYDPATSQVFVQNYRSNNVSEISPATNTVVRNISGGDEPDANALDPVADEVAIPNQFSGNVSFLYAATDSIVASVSVIGGNPNAIAFDDSSGDFFVTDGGLLTEIGLPLPKYVVTFTESGLPSGSAWTVTLNGRANSSTTPSIEFVEPDGTYSFTVGTVAGYSSNQTAGEVKVNGGPADELVSFSLLSRAHYAINLIESGLRAGTSWSVTLNGSIQSSMTDVISFSDPNGSYAYSVGIAAGFGPSPANGSVVVQGAPVGVSVSFLRVYSLFFNETTLPQNTNWSVTLTGNASSVVLVVPLLSGSLTRWSDGASAIHFLVSNGTYSYSTEAPGHASSTGSLTVRGQNPAPVVVSFPSSSSPPSGLTLLDYLIIGAVVVVVGIGAVVVLMRRRQKVPPARTVPPSSSGEGAPPAPP